MQLVCLGKETWEAKSTSEQNCERGYIKFSVGEQGKDWSSHLKLEFFEAENFGDIA